MQTQPPPSAHVCTTLPPGDLTLRNQWPADRSAMYLKSDCDRLHRYISQIGGNSWDGPIGAWRCCEVRIADDGQEWIKHNSKRHESYLVIDNFGDLVEVASGQGGAA